ncbi:hypothetical protein BJ944DRAFT_250531 [Cunninghamella echinulata]|nr:hypothetical protein BJ944DRAFT_250531 [Cunninghamella echinulata]
MSIKPKKKANQAQISLPTINTSTSATAILYPLAAKQLLEQQRQDLSWSSVRLITTRGIYPSSSFLTVPGSFYVPRLLAPLLSVDTLKEEEEEEEEEGEEGDHTVNNMTGILLNTTLNSVPEHTEQKDDISTSPSTIETSSPILPKIQKAMDNSLSSLQTSNFIIEHNSNNNSKIEMVDINQSIHTSIPSLEISVNTTVIKENNEKVRSEGAHHSSPSLSPLIDKEAHHFSTAFIKDSDTHKVELDNDHKNEPTAIIATTTTTTIMTMDTAMGINTSLNKEDHVTILENNHVEKTKENVTVDIDMEMEDSLNTHDNIDSNNIHKEEIMKEKEQEKITAMPMANMNMNVDSDKIDYNSTQTKEQVEEKEKEDMITEVADTNVAHDNIIQNKEIKVEKEKVVDNITTNMDIANAINNNGSSENVSSTTATSTLLEKKVEKDKTLQKESHMLLPRTAPIQQKASTSTSTRNSESPIPPKRSSKLPIRSSSSTPPTARSSKRPSGSPLAERSRTIPSIFSSTSSTSSNSLTSSPSSSIENKSSKKENDTSSIKRYKPTIQSYSAIDSSSKKNSKERMNIIKEKKEKVNEDPDNINSEEDEERPKPITRKEKLARKAKREEQIKFYRAREQREEREARLAQRRQLMASHSKSKDNSNNIDGQSMMVVENGNQTIMMNASSSSSSSTSTNSTTIQQQQQQKRKGVKFNLMRNKVIEITTTTTTDETMENHSTRVPKIRRKIRSPSNDY